MGENLDLKVKAISGARITTAMTAYKGLIELGANLILVRLLAPDVFGSMAFAYILVQLAGISATISSASAIIQKKGDLNEKYIDVAFTVEFFLSLLVTIILLIGSPYIMAHLGKPNLSFYTQMIALTLPLKKLAFPSVIFLRKLNFNKANIAPAISVPVSAGVTILFALLGFGIWCFFWGAIVGDLISAIVVWSILPYRPKFKFDWKTFKDLAMFGLPLTGSALLAYYYWNVDDFMVGTILSAEQLGYYWLAFKIPHYILNAQNSITSVVFPIFARAEDHGQLKAGFEFLTKFSAILLLLPCAISLVLGEPAIRLILGEEWLPALLPFQIFMVLITVRGTVVYWTQVLIVKGKTSVLLKITVQNAVILTLLGYFFTKNVGIAGTSAAVLFTIIVSLPYTAWQLKKCLDVSYLKMLWKGVVSFVLVLTMGFLLRRVMPSPTCFFFLAEVAVMAAMYLGVIVLLDKKFVQIVKDLMKDNSCNIGVAG